ncbi:MAG: MFS transporter, partial [Gemmatimonadota bacterium]
FFSFYGILEKSSAALGPAVFGLASQLLGTGRAGILALIAFFALGAFLLTRVDVERGRRTAQLEDAAATTVET